MHPKHPVISAAILLLSGGLANAAAITDIASVPLTLQPWTQTVSVPQFNPALGTLNSIALSLTENAQGAVIVTNNDNVARDTTTSVTVFLTLERPDLTMLVGDSISATFIQAGLGPHQSTTFSMLPEAATNATLLAPPSAGDLGLFSGTGNVSLPVVASAFGSPTGPVSAALDIEDQVSALVSVTYDFKPLVVTSEPASAALLGAGLLGLVVLRRCL